MAVFFLHKERYRTPINGPNVSPTYVPPSTYLSIGTQRSEMTILMLQHDPTVNGWQSVLLEAVNSATDVPRDEHIRLLHLRDPRQREWLHTWPRWGSWR